MKTVFRSDIDLDFGNRNDILSVIPHVHASMRNVDPIRRHNSGVHVTEIPYNPVDDMCALDYSEAESRGYVKLDFLNVWVYSLVKDEEHLISLMRDPDWSKLQNAEYVDKLVHLGRHYNVIENMPEPVNSVARLMMLLAIIRPSKRHLIGLPWAEVAKTVWDKENDGYVFKKAHACAYAHLVIIHMNLIDDGVPGAVMASVLPT